MKFKIYSKSNNSNSRTNTPKLIECNYINSIKKEILESVGLLGKGAFSKFDSNGKVGYLLSDTDSEFDSSFSIKSESEEEILRKEYDNDDHESYLKKINLSIRKDLGNINISVREGEECEVYKQSFVLNEEITAKADNHSEIDIWPELKEDVEELVDREKNNGEIQNIKSYKNRNGVYTTYKDTPVVNSLVSDNCNDENSYIVDSKNPSIFEIGQVLKEENDINKLRENLFNKLDLLEHKLQSVKNYSNMNDSFHNNIKDAKNSSELNVIIEDILNNIGKNFIVGLNSLIENSHDKLVNAFSCRNRININNIRNIIFEYNEIEFNNILTLRSNKMLYKSINEMLKYPIKGIGYWCDQGLEDKFNDRWFASKLTSGSFFGILDSYNGDYAANHAEKLIVNEFDRLIDCEDNINNSKVANVMLKTIISVDQKILHLSKTNNLNTGSGLISCFIFYSEINNNYILFSCNLGNCRGFLSRNNSIIKFSNQTNINNSDIDCYYVVESGIGFGMYKPPVKSYYEINNTPYVLSIELSLSIDKYIVMATDSIWKVFNEEDMNEFINCIINQLYTDFPKLNKNIISNIISHSVVTESLLRGVTDNLICMTALF
ncbi:hypothetical protein FG386_003090 [Cryptosporidium ryanae]|uniref:uncharacterized protein n=1 Tax=Cryptosporidium ryanae TaxID=515981 RepID=UPI003519E147|nr:hypothetical protein FG386_003090 [Cryptosporidium ryanae]